MTALPDESRTSVPGYIWRTLDTNGNAVGTCFHVGDGRFVTSLHVLDDLAAGSPGSQVRLDSLDQAPRRTAVATVLWVNDAHDLAIMYSDDEGVLKSSASLASPGQVNLGAMVLLAGVANIDDGDIEYRSIQAIGTWQGFVVREGTGPIQVYRARCQDLLPGMSGSPVRMQGSGVVVGIVSGRFNSVDGWLRDTVWISATEPIADQLGIELTQLLDSADSKTRPLVLPKSPAGMFVDIYRMSRSMKSRREREEVRGLTEQLLVQVHKERDGRSSASNLSSEPDSLSESLDLLVDEILRVDPSAAELLISRARLREGLGRWPQALDDLQAAVNLSGRLDDSLCLAVGRNLMTMGNYSQSVAVLKRATAGEVADSDRMSARQFIAWIDDYQGRHEFAISSLHSMAVDAEVLGLPREVLGSIDHRIGRAMYSAAIGSSNRPSKVTLQSAYSYVQRGLDRIGPGNPFGAAWLSIIGQHLDAGRADRDWQRAEEGLRELGLPGEAHIFAIRACRLLRDGGARSARQLLWDCMEMWRDLGYPNGVLDCSLTLIRLYRRELANTAGDRREGLLVAGLSRILATNLRSPALREAEEAFFGIRDAVKGDGGNRVVQAVQEELWSEFGGILRVREFILPN